MLADLFETNTFWTLAMNRATAKRIEPGLWEVKVEFDAHKQIVDEAAGEADSPMDHLVEVDPRSLFFDSSFSDDGNLEGREVQNPTSLLQSLELL